MNQVGVQVFERDPQHPLHVFPVAGMHEVDAFAKGLIAVDYGPAEIVRHEPFGGFGFSARNVSKAIVLAT